MVVETDEECSIFGTVDVVQFTFAAHLRVRVGRREDDGELALLGTGSRTPVFLTQMLPTGGQLVDAVVATMMATSVLPMVVPVQCRRLVLLLLVIRRRRRVTPGQGVDAARAERPLEDVAPVPLRGALDVRPGRVIRRAADRRRWRTRRKRQRGHVVVVL